MNTNKVSLHLATQWLFTFMVFACFKPRNLWLSSIKQVPGLRVKWWKVIIIYSTHTTTILTRRD